MTEADKKLQEAIKNNDLKKVKKLLNAFWSSQRASLVSTDTNKMPHPLTTAAIHGRIEIMEYLLEQGANINQKGKLSLTALDEAIAQNQAEAFSCLIKHGADVNSRSGGAGYTPCIHAIRAGNHLFLKELIDNGADIEAPFLVNQTALHVAITHDETECSRCLLENNANIEAKDTWDRTPLIVAAVNGVPDQIDILLDYGADINAYDEDGNTALMSAILKNEHKSPEKREQVIQLLIEKKADIRLENKQGISPYSWASKNPKDNVSKIILKKKGGKQQPASDLKSLDPSILNSLMITDTLLQSIKDQSYEEQVNTYKIVKDTLPPETKKAFEKHIRSTRLKKKGKGI